jgi:pimeloyl-ACP methyl ester carboxylesterase
MWEADEAETAQVMRACRERLAPDQDLAQYTTSVAVQDLDAVRAALGYERIALYGSSYGTRVAQHYARRFPGHTQALLLDGVVPPTQVLGPTTPLDAEGALQKIFTRCRANAACMQRFGDPETDYRELRTKLAQRPVDVALADPVSGEPRELLFSTSLFAGALRLASYSADQAALLPLVLHLANDENQFVPLASQYLLAAADYDAVLAYGMHNSVVCAEDVPFFATAKIDRERVAQSFLGSSQLDALQALCDGWPRGPVDADLHAPLASDVPTLLLSGDSDPVTPAAFAEEAARGLTAAQLIVLPGQGHGQLMQPCVDRLMAAFLNEAMPGKKPAIDTSCLRGVAPAPFFLSLNGPGP